MQKQYQRPEAQIVEGGDVVCSSQEQSQICDEIDTMIWLITQNGTYPYDLNFIHGVTTAAEVEAWLRTVEHDGHMGWEKTMLVTITPDGQVICGSSHPVQE